MTAVMPRRANSFTRALSYSFSKNPAPKVFETSNAAPITASVREFKSTLSSRSGRSIFSYPCLSVPICGPIFFGVLALTSLPHLHFHSFHPLPAPTPHRPTTPSRIIQPAVKPGRADRRSLVNPRLCRIQASRPGNIEERAGHGGESILWLIRTSRERREVTAKGNRRARLKVDSDTFLRPQPPVFFIPGGLLT